MYNVPSKMQYMQHIHRKCRWETNCLTLGILQLSLQTYYQVSNADWISKPINHTPLVTPTGLPLYTSSYSLNPVLVVLSYSIAS